MRSTPDRLSFAAPRSRPRHDPFRHQGVIVEEERDEAGRAARMATVFLTGRECPWRCAMCDLWQHTTVLDTPRGAIPRQLEDALREIRLGDAPAPSGVKLYNAGSFFDPRAVPQDDYDLVAAQVAGFSRVIVESHPALVGERVSRFRAALEGRRHIAAHGALEVAMGLETAHPGALARLNKGMTRESFREAAVWLVAHGIALRVFLLAPAPFVVADEQAEWLLRSVDFAFDCGASVVSVVPLRTENEPARALAAQGLATAPRLGQIEAWFASALDRAAGRGRVFLDLWDLERFREDDSFDDRRARLHRMNLEQGIAG